MLFDDESERLRYAGEAFFSTPEPARADAFDTSNLGDDLGMQRGGEMASVQITDWSPTERSVSFVNDDDPGIYMNRNGEQRKAGEMPEMRNPIEQSFIEKVVPNSMHGLISSPNGNGWSIDDKRFESVHIDGDVRSPETTRKTMEAIKDYRDGVRQRDRDEMRSLLGITISR